MELKLLIVIVFYFGTLFCQDSLSLKITSDDFASIDITREDYFNDGSLWGYMNGGADLYLEYGFDELLVEEVIVDGENIKIEVFKMNDQRSAFGIYSVKHYKCNSVRSDGIFSCITNYQYQFVINEYYISVINQTGTEKAQLTSTKICEKLLHKIKKKEFEFPGFLRNDIVSENLNKSVLMYSRLGISSGHEEWDEVFEDAENYSILKTPIIFEDGKFTLIQIEMEDNLRSKLLKEYNFEFSISIDEGVYSKDEEYIYWIKKVENGKYLFVEGKAETIKFKSFITEFFN
ncbi:MAG: hypothetical protein JEY94_07660 [Melioribacteraceae bacterium]|nr:hypothetical protein [Melioribacteraceae bacterium]